MLCAIQLSVRPARPWHTCQHHNNRHSCLAPSSQHRAKVHAARKADRRHATAATRQNGTGRGDNNKWTTYPGTQLWECCARTDITCTLQTVSGATVSILKLHCRACTKSQPHVQARHRPASPIGNQVLTATAAVPVKMHGEVKRGPYKSAWLLCLNSTKAKPLELPVALLRGRWHSLTSPSSSKMVRSCAMSLKPCTHAVAGGDRRTPMGTIERLFVHVCSPTKFAAAIVIGADKLPCQQQSAECRRHMHCTYLAHTQDHVLETSGHAA